MSFAAGFEKIAGKLPVGESLRKVVNRKAGVFSAPNFAEHASAVKDRLATPGMQKAMGKLKPNFARRHPIVAGGATALAVRTALGSDSKSEEKPEPHVHNNRQY